MCFCLSTCAAQEIDDSEEQAEAETETNTETRMDQTNGGATEYRNGSAQGQDHGHDHDHDQDHDQDQDQVVVVKSGWLTKRGGIRKNWKKRWWVPIGRKPCSPLMMQGQAFCHPCFLFGVLQQPNSL